MRISDQPLKLGFSPCPNDCFLFYGLAHGLVDHELLEVRLADVEELNKWALRGELEVTKLSYHAYAHVSDRYVMLPAGGALGQNVGPLVVTREKLASLSGKTVAVPGGLTTANLLLQLWQPQDLRRVELRYDRIMPAVSAGEVDAGLIIHESRFTYPQHGLVKHVDLGEWWFAETGKLLPLGGIAALRGLGRKRLDRLGRAIKESLEYAYLHPAEVAPFVARHAQEMSPVVRRQHIELYVNDYTRDIGRAGREAVEELFSRGRARSVLPEPSAPLFAS